MSTLGSVYLPLADPMNRSDLEHSVNQVRMSIDLCYDHLPSLLNVEDDKTPLFLEPIVFSFPYHPPSRFSSTISSISSPNESMSHILQQVAICTHIIGFILEHGLIFTLWSHIYKYARNLFIQYSRVVFLFFSVHFCQLFFQK